MVELLLLVLVVVVVLAILARTAEPSEAERRVRQVRAYRRAAVGTWESEEPRRSMEPGPAGDAEDGGR